MVSSRMKSASWFALPPNWTASSAGGRECELPYKVLDDNVETISGRASINDHNGSEFQVFGKMHSARVQAT